MSYLFTLSTPDSLVYDSASNLTVITSTDSYTMTAWLRKASAAGANGMGVMAVGRTATIQYRSSISIGSGEDLSAGISSGTGVSSTVGTTSTGVWYFAANVLTYTGTGHTATAVLGTEGGSVALGTTSAEKTLTSWPQDITIGRPISQDTSAYNFDGYIAEVALFSKALSEAELNDLCSKTPDTCSASANLVAYWPLVSDTNDAVGSLHMAVSSGAPSVNAAHPSISGGGASAVMPRILRPRQVIAFAPPGSY